MNATVADFERINAKYGGDKMNHIFGPTSLGFPEDVDSNRLYMFSSNLKQILIQEDPDVPHVLQVTRIYLAVFLTDTRKLRANGK